MKRIISIILSITIILSLVNTQAGAAGTTVAPTSVSLTVAQYIMSWQQDTGGWSKLNSDHFTRKWDGKEKISAMYQQDKKTPIATIDNYATTTEMEYLVKVYNETKNSTVKKSILEGFDFLLTMQYPSGGFPQGYPKQDANVSDYENDATYNDEATVNVMKLYSKVLDKEAGYDSSLISSTLYNQIKESYNRSLDYILKSQIEVNGVKTGWGGQHDPITYKTTWGRAFEPKSISAQDTALLTSYLKSLNSNDKDVQIAIVSAEKWLSDVVVKDTTYILKGDNGEYFKSKSGTNIWYRYYEIGTNKGIFGDMDYSVHYDIKEISEERRHNYGWAGNWGKYILKDTIGRDLVSELNELNGSVAIIEEIVPVEEVEEVDIVVNEPVSSLNNVDFTTSGLSYIDESGYHFVDGDNGFIQTPSLGEVKQGDAIKINLTISETNRVSSDLFVDNEGLRFGRGVWTIGHGVKSRTIEFVVSEDTNSNNSFIRLEANNGTNKESITVSNIEVFLNGESVVAGNGVEEPVIEEPVIEEPVIEEPVVEEPVVEEPVVEEPVIEEPVVEEPVVEEPVIEEPVIEEPVVEVVIDKNLKTSGNSFVDSTGLHFIDGDSGYIRTPSLGTIEQGDKIKINMTISAASRTKSDLFMASEGLRDGRGVWSIGHGVKSRTIEFTVSNDTKAIDSYIQFEVNNGTSKEEISVSDLEVFVNGKIVFAKEASKEEVEEEVEEEVVEEVIEEVVEEVEEVQFQGSYSATGNNSINGSTFLFEDGDGGYIKTPKISNVKQGDEVKIILTVSKANRVNSDLFMINEGLRQNRSNWTIGHGVKTRTIEFVVSEDTELNDSYIKFGLENGSEGETIEVNELDIYINGKLVE